jgi:hypothetical protein
MATLFETGLGSAASAATSAQRKIALSAKMIHNMKNAIFICLKVWHGA